MVNCLESEVKWDIPALHDALLCERYKSLEEAIWEWCWEDVLCCNLLEV